MILIQFREGRHAPVIMCDICEKRITDAKMAAVVSSRRGEGGEFDPALIEVLHAHKGPCHDSAEKRLGGPANSGWAELSTHLLLLIQNVGLKPSDLATEDDIRRQAGLEG